MINRKGMAIYVAVAISVIVAIMVGFLAIISGSQIRQSLHFQEHAAIESTAWAALELGIAKLMDNASATAVNGQIRSIYFGLLISPMGTGFLNQKNYMLFAQSLSERVSYSYIVSCEQFPRDPVTSPDPNVVISREFWGTNDKVDISNAAHCEATMNGRGADLAEFDENRKFEQERTDSEYETFLLTKTSKLPSKIKTNWQSLYVPILKDRKYEIITVGF
ncbi:MAG: hypothetical protein HQM10_07100 [Candidatus Riflebacteria bacterium]|nr:hypothetical protein [Candidatus Riflebacteria bacterium]